MSFRFVCLFAASALSASAAVLPVTSYSGLNGAVGSFNYQDFSYLPCPTSSCITSAAALSGGTGKLTDGVSPSLDWYQQGNATSWVGWDNTQGLANPTVTFFFGQTVTVNSVTLWESNSRSGGVSQPGAVVIGGVTNVLAPDSVNTSPHAITFSGLNITGSSLALQFNQAAGFNWVMLGEVSFSGVPSAIPEPGSFALVVLAAIGLVTARRICN